MLCMVIERIPYKFAHAVAVDRVAWPTARDAGGFPRAVVDGQLDATAPDWGARGGAREGRRARAHSRARPLDYCLLVVVLDHSSSSSIFDSLSLSYDQKLPN